MHAKSLQLCPALRDPMDCSHTVSSVHGLLQERILKWVAIPPPGNLPNPGIRPGSLITPALAARFFIASATGEAQKEP